MEYIAGCKPCPKLSKNEFNLCVLTFVNTVNFMDRFTVSAILPQLQKNFHISNSTAGLSRTIFIITYMIASPIFGYLGDRFSRKRLIIGGLLLWIISSISSSFSPDFTTFVILRIGIGIGEACFTTISPSLIGDFYSELLLAKALGFYYFAIPVGSGLGYIIGSFGVWLFEDWRWGLRMTPILATAALLLTITVKDPRKDKMEEEITHRSFYKELITLFGINSYIIVAFAYCFVVFSMGAMTFWMPKFSILGINIQGKDAAFDSLQNSMAFGLTVIVAGVIGVPGGAFLSNYSWKHGFAKGDPLICGLGIIGAAIIEIGCMDLARQNSIAFIILLFIAVTLMNLQWSVTTNMVLVTVPKSIRSLATALNIFLSHALGDATSPYIVGAITDYSMTFCKGEKYCEYAALRTSLYANVAVQFAGGILFCTAAFFIQKDIEKANEINSRAINRS